MSGRSGQRGYVLVTTLGVMLVLSGLVASSSLFAHSVLRSARTEVATDQLGLLLRGGLEITAYQLFSLDIAPAAVNGREIRFGPGSVTPRVTDEAGRIDVNAADPALLAGALQVAGVDTGTIRKVVERLVAARAAATRIPERVRSDMGPRSGEVEGGGAAAADPFAPPDPLDASSRADFRTVAEFLTFAGLDGDDRTALLDLLTVMNPDGRLNVLAASRRALLAIPGMSVVAVDTLMAERRAVTRPDLATLQASLDRFKAYVKFEGGPCYRVHLASRDAAGRQASREAIIAAGRDGNDPYYVLDWQ